MTTNKNALPKRGESYLYKNEGSGEAVSLRAGIDADVYFLELLSGSPDRKATKLIIRESMDSENAITNILKFTAVDSLSDLQLSVHGDEFPPVTRDNPDYFEVVNRGHLKGSYEISLNGSNVLCDVAEVTTGMDLTEEKYLPCSGEEITAESEEITITIEGHEDSGMCYLTLSVLSDSEIAFKDPVPKGNLFFYLMAVLPEIINHEVVIKKQQSDHASIDGINFRYQNAVLSECDITEFEILSQTVEASLLNISSP
ncbi:hypothetical protein [Gimesia algae]|uniref:Uncharacterized protein n=1 Tax=Gimesia algae TaxID=2527971 RepID=A0A517V844_9PLAN|nr:hypothetical protein [Gimesia algae]QDT89173.1 hypothetical protein Pan161_07990 [Gimesia algae]